MALVEADYVRYWPSSQDLQAEWGRQEAQRLKEQQYRQQLARMQMEKQELYRRQVEAYQRLQAVTSYSTPYYQAGINSTWSQTTSAPTTAPTSSAVGGGQRVAPQAGYGQAPMVRKPTTDSLKSLMKPLSVDCSVEYELPEFLKVTKDGPPLLMIQQQRRPCPLGGGCAKCAQRAARHHQQAARHAPQQQLEAKAGSKGRSTGSQGIVTRRRSSLKSDKAFSVADQSQSSAMEQLAKVSLKRKYMELEGQEAEYKRQKMMSLTPPDIVSTSQFYLDSGSVYGSQMANMYYQQEPVYGRVPPGPAMFAASLEEQQRLRYRQMYHQQMMPCACHACRRGLALMGQ